VDELSANAEPARLERLREALLLRGAAQALDQGFALDRAALAALPPEVDTPLTNEERAGLEVLSSQLERTVTEVVASQRHDRGFALVLAQARYLAARRSLAANRLVVLDAFSGAIPAPIARGEEPSDSLRARWRAQAAGLLERAREEALARAQLDE